MGESLEEVEVGGRNLRFKIEFGGMIPIHRCWYG